MNSRNKVVRSCANCCCNWGYRTTVQAQNYVGGPVPLLRNPAKRFFKWLVILNIAFLFSCTLIFIVQQFSLNKLFEEAEATIADENIDEKDEMYLAAQITMGKRVNCIALATDQIFMMIAFGLNTCLMIIFARTEKASD